MTEQTLTVKVQDFCDYQTNTINLGRLFAESERQHAQLVTRRRPFAEKQPQPFGSLQPALASLFAGKQQRCQALVPDKTQTIRRPEPPLSLPIARGAEKKRKLALTKLKAKSYAIERAQGALLRYDDAGTYQGQAHLHSIGQQRVTLPFFADQHITAAALKHLCGQPQDVLLKQEGERWRIVDDTELVDLKDEAQAYRLGPIQIYS
jgi:hypothetical protein